MMPGMQVRKQFAVQRRKVLFFGSVWHKQNQAKLHLLVNGVDHVLQGGPFMRSHQRYFFAVLGACDQNADPMTIQRDLVDRLLANLKLQYWVTSQQIRPDDFERLGTFPGQAEFVMSQCSVHVCSLNEFLSLATAGPARTRSRHKG